MVWFLIIIAVIGSIGYLLWRYFYTAPGCKIEVKYGSHNSGDGWIWRVSQNGEVFIDSGHDYELTRLGARFVAAREVRRFRNNEDEWKEV